MIRDQHLWNHCILTNQKITVTRSLSSTCFLFFSLFFFLTTLIPNCFCFFFTFTFSTLDISAWLLLFIYLFTHGRHSRGNALERYASPGFILHRHTLLFSLPQLDFLLIFCLRGAGVSLTSSPPPPLVFPCIEKLEWGTMQTVWRLTVVSKWFNYSDLHEHFHTNIG